MSVIFCLIFFLKYGKESYAFYGDSLGYYSYLPAFLIYEDFDSFKTLKNDTTMEGPVRDYFRSQEEELQSPLGHTVMSYTYGVSLFEAPFFVVAQVIDEFKDKTRQDKTRQCKWIY